MSDIQRRIALGDGSAAMIDCFGCDEYSIQTSRGRVNFEWSEMFGPLPVGSRGVPLDLPHTHPFWRAVSLWNLQGRRVENGMAIWREPKKPVLKHMGGRHWMVVEQGEPDHDW